jgi:hypothetical protein
MPLRVINKTGAGALRPGAYVDASRLSAVLLVVLVVLAGPAAFADSLTMITSPSALAPNDSVQWSRLGGNGHILGQSSSTTSANGVPVTLNLSGPNSIIAVACPASSCSWSGAGLPSGDTLVWTSNGGIGGNGPATFTFGRAQAGAGTYIQADGPAAFTAQIQAFNGSTLLGSFVETSNSNGQAIYLGVLDNTGANISSIVLSLSSAQSSLADFAFDSINLTSGTSGGSAPPPAAPTATATATTVATPVPRPGAFIGSSSSISTSLSVPAGVQTGDLLLAFYSYWSLTSATAPNGWQLLQTATSNGSGVEAVWYRFATSADSPGTTYSWSFGGTAYQSGGMLSFRGIDPSALQDGFCINQGNGTAPNLCSFTTSFSNDVYVGFFATENINLSLPGDLSELMLDQYANGSYFGAAAATKSLGAAGIVPADFGSMNSGGWATVAVALKLASAGAAPTMAPTAAPTPASGAITLIGSSTTTSSTITVPSGVQSGDLLLAFYSYWSYASATPPAGWQTLQSSTSSGSGVETVWYRFATSADTQGASYSWSFTGTPYAAGGILAYRGVDPSNPFDGFCHQDGSSGSPNWCSFSTVYSNDEYVALSATENTGLTFPGDLTSEVLKQYFNGEYFGVGAAEKTLGVAGTVPADTGSMSSGGWATIAMALKPVSTGPPAATPIPTATPVPPPMVSFVNSTQTTSATQTAPASIEVGDLLLAFYSYWYKATATAPTGWAQLYSEPTSSSGVETVWYKFATAGDIGANYNWMFSGPAPYEAGGMLAYRNVASISMMPDVDGSCLDQGNNGSPTLCSFSNTTANDVYVGFYCTENTGLVLPGDVTTRVIQQYVNGEYFGVAAVDKQLPSAGLNGADTGSMNSGGWETVVFALKP